MVLNSCSIMHPSWLFWKDTLFNKHVIDLHLGLLRDAINCSAHWHDPNSPLAKAGLHPLWRCSRVVEKKNVLGLSLYCRDFGLEAEKRSVCPITEELKVLKELMAGLQDIKLIGQLDGEGGGGWSQLWCFNSQHL